jgi:hypothetical protein
MNGIIDYRLKALFILTKLDLNNPCDATFWCLFLHVFFLLFRKSNLVPNSVSSFKAEKQLNRKNSVYDPDIATIGIINCLSPN